VISCEQAQTAPTTSFSSRKNKKDKAAQVQTDPLLEIILHDTILFPEGGGQPHDIGIFTSSDGDLWNVIDVKRRGGHAIHYVQVKDSDIQKALAAFIPGSIVGIALGEDGLQRRLDHMCMHTSQHLLSAVLEQKLNLPTLSWSLTAYPTPSYVEIPRGMTAEEIAHIQAECNRLVFEGRQIHVEVQDFDREQLPDVERLDNGRTVGAGVPEDYTGGALRTIVIEGVDRNPCCGTHLPSLHNLQLFLLPHTEGLSRASTTSARLYFLAGPRLITYLTSTHIQLSAAAASMSCGAPQVSERVEQVIEERKRAVKRVDDLETELAVAVAKQMLGALYANSGVKFKIHNHRMDDTNNALGLLSSISTAFGGEIAAAPGTPVPPYLLVLSSSPSSQTPSSTSVVLVFGTDEKDVKAVGDLLKSKLGVKGGGKGTKWSGKFTGVWREAREGVEIDEILKGI